MGRYEGPIVDIDFHHRWKKEADVTAYLPKEWRDYVKADPRGAFPIKPPASSTATRMSDGARMIETWPEDGSPPGSDPDTTKRQLLDRHRLFRAVALHDVGDYANHLNPYYGTALARAVNDWNVDHWADVDERLYTVVLIGTSQPKEAATEVRRVGKHPKMVGVLLSSNPLGRSYGDPLYDPILKAAADLGLAIVVHPGAGGLRPNFTYAGGSAGSDIVSISQWSQSAFQIVSSFITHGTFEKFPKLKVIITEYGVAWLPFVMWRLDQNYELLRRESPWVKRRPSEYIRDHIKLGTQPIEESPKPGGLAKLLETVDGMDSLLCFSSDYPHQAFDDPNYVVRILPKGWERKVMCDNACEVFGWESPAAQPVATLVGTAPSSAG